MQQLREPVGHVGALLRAGFTESAHRAIGESIGPALENALLVAHRVSDGTRVVHYTATSVLKSIVGRLLNEENVSLRAYDTVHVNDPTEGQYLLDFIPRHDPWLNGIHAKLYATTHAYSTSFIVDTGGMNNKLEFWRAYGDQGEGCSLSFLVSKQRPPLWQVRYGDASARSTANTIMVAVNQLKTLVALANQQHRDLIEKRLIEILLRVLNRIRYVHKSDIYSYEKECRFILLVEDVTDDVQFEYSEQGQGSPRIRHYIEHEHLDIRNYVLVTDSELMLGPTINRPQNATFYFKHMIRTIGLPTSVEFSGLPYQKP